MLTARLKGLFQSSSVIKLLGSSSTSVIGKPSTPIILINHEHFSTVSNNVTQHLDGNTRNFSIMMNSVTRKSNAERFLETELIRHDQKKRNSQGINHSEPQQQNDKYLSNPEAYSKFLKLNLMGAIAKAATHFLQFSAPTEIQEHVIPQALTKSNIVASAETGTGKTAAYGFPILQKIIHEKIRRSHTSLEEREIGTLVLCPTKELSEQVYQHLNNFKKYTLEILRDEGKIDDEFDIKLGIIFGGASKISQLKTIQQGLDILVATPGRLVELLKTNDGCKLKTVRYLILDECDRMLNMGFLPELKRIYEHLPKPNETKEPMQVFMFSATLTRDVEDLVCRFAPTHKMINLNQEFKIPETIKHIKYFVSKKELKFKLLLYLLGRKGSLKNKKVLIFCRTRDKVERMAENLTNRGYKAIGIHKEKSLAFRTKAIKSFSLPDNSECQILVATDVLARGIDVPDLPFVINYDVPAKPEDYVHRVGRTGRAGQEGMAFSFIAKVPIITKVGGRLVELNEEHFIKTVEQFISQRIEERKIPGVWQDRYMNQLEQEKQKVEEISKRKALEILEKKRQGRNKKDPHDEKMVAAFSESYNRLKQKVEQTKTLTSEDLKYAPTLRHFKEGRYEDVMKEFEVKRAIKEGAIKRVDTKSKSRKKKKKKFIYQL
ncbi:hypothetical protein C9374_011447 [Naegleria lovaniensis]|uniref:Uncharacterized protein n=1 Tax=Naegleria lovaniensis TaxID=51637 RepID=A0AA88KQW4_NAELO|nr:uncharacterized protein C9374_011447 [Naegleria lovaniensis]KAG2392722.1 hypothetical protein C9374_011447 [Naegleria lovaniensis]